MRRQQQARRAWQAFAWGAAIFVVLQLGLTAIMESWLPQLRDPTYGFKLRGLRRKMRAAGLGDSAKTPRPAKVVVMLGTSRVTTGLCGAVVEGELARKLGCPVVLYNFGVPADSPLHELLNLERLLADGIRPDLLLIEVFPSFLQKGAQAALAGIPVERMGFRDRAVLARNNLPVTGLPHYTFRSWALPWHVHRFDLIGVLTPWLVPYPICQGWARHCDADGYIRRLPGQVGADRQKALAYTRRTFGASLSSFELGGPFCAALEKILERCRQEQMAVALVLMPEGPFLQGLYGAGAWEQVTDYLKTLTAKYGTPVINARDWVDEHGFFDSSHLDPPGAALFTRRLGREYVLPLLRNPPVPR
jgi:hypothetical protein